MPVPDVLKFGSNCKDYLHAEWADFKVTAQAKSAPICIYNLGNLEVPKESLESVCNVIKELEGVIKECFKTKYEKSRVVTSYEIMVIEDGQLSFYPRRETIDKPDTPQTADTSMPSVDKRKKQQTPEEAFMGGVEQVGNYILDHIKRISENALLNGNVKALYLVLSAAIFMKNRIQLYKKIFKPTQIKGLTTTFSKYDEIIHLTSEHVFNYQNDLIRLCILHDVSSHDWYNHKPYMEGEKMSLCIQMWAFHIQAVRHDMWLYLPPKSAEDLFASIFVDSLGLLVHRYSSIEPSQARMTQMKADMIAILQTTLFLLPSLLTSPQNFFQSRLHTTRSFTVHRRADLLVRIAGLKCAPIESLVRAFPQGIIASEKISANAKDPTTIAICPDWLSFLNPDLFPKNTKNILDLPSHIATYLVLLVASSRAYQDPVQILRGIMMKDLLGAKTIINGLKFNQLPLMKGDTCGGALCMEPLCNPPLLPHTVCAAIIQIILKCKMKKSVIYDLLFEGLEGSNMDSLDRSQIWNIQRPPWYHCLVQLVSGKIGSVIAQVLQVVPTVPPAQPAHPSQLSVRLEHHLSAWTLQLISGVENIADTFHPSLIHISMEINKIIPSNIKPVGGHVIAQLVVSALYSVVNSRKSLDELCPSGPISDGQWDMMVAIGERLCLLHEGNYENGLTLMIDELLKQADKPELDDDDLDYYDDEEFVESVSQEFADMVLSTVQGQHSFGIIWQFLVRNVDWVANLLEAPPLIKGAIVSPILSFSKVPEYYNPLKAYDKLFYTKYNQKTFIDFNGNWKAILNGDLWLPNKNIEDYIRKRPEFKKNAVLNLNQQRAVLKLHQNFSSESET